MFVAQISRVPLALAADSPHPTEPDLPAPAAWAPLVWQAHGSRFRALLGCFGQNPKQWIASSPSSTPEHARSAGSTRLELRLPDTRPYPRRTANAPWPFLPHPPRRSGLSTSSYQPPPLPHSPPLT